MVKYVTKEFLNSKVKVFKDEIGTKFIKGPFDVDGETYDFKFIDSKGFEDYCTEYQILEWKPLIKPAY